MFDFLYNAFNQLYGLIVAIPNFLADLINAIVYLFGAAGQLLVLVLQIAYGVFNLLLSFGVGAINTIQSITNPTYSWGTFTNPIGQLRDAIYLDTIGWVLAGVTWIIVAVSVIRAVRNH